MNNFLQPKFMLLILGKMKKVAETCLVQSVSKAVIAAPVCFSDAQKKEIESAGKIAGLDVLGIVDEPIAAVLCCKNINNGVIAVFNLGGSTFDVSILEISNRVIKVKARSGDLFLGGEDFDHVLVEYLVEEIRRVYSVDISGDRTAMMRLKEAAEKAKVKLSSSLQALIHVRYLTVCGLDPVHANITLSRSKFEELVECLIERTRIHCKNCLKDASISVEEIDEVILIGGMSRVPRVQQIVGEIFKKSPRIEVNPDEAVAVGAALQGALIIEDQSRLLPGMTPLSLGIETSEGSFMRIINRNSMIPSKASRNISTSCDNQGHACIRILQGEHEIASGNKLLGELMLTGIPPVPQGVPCIELTFDVDNDGTLTVSAKVKDTGKEKAITIRSSGNTSEDLVKMMVKEAILCGRRNMEKSILTRIRSMAKVRINRIEKILNMKRKVIPEELLVETHHVLIDLKNVLDSEDVFLVKSKIDAAESAELDVLWWKPDDEYSDESDES
uniref:Uncharacterized protein n=1 Tax=Davidia involucrata TaxID=16924 RepID=A0A5B7C6A2_DAVIN